MTADRPVPGRAIEPRGSILRAGFRLLMLLLACAAASCSDDREAVGGRAPESDSILVFAASDLQTALAEVASDYERETGSEVTLVFGSTGNLTAQIENGAPADLFFAANQSFLDRLAAEDLLQADTRRLYARGRLALVWADGASRPASIRDLTAPQYRTTAIANPAHAPYGMAAREAMRAVGIWDEVSSKLVLAENIAQTMQFVRSGNADVGVVALSLAPDSAARLVVPDSLHAPLDQGAAVLRGSRNAGGARAFLDHVTGAAGQSVLRRYGFDPPPP